jgi:NADH-quinone oxidoreductase subunit N
MDLPTLDMINVMAVLPIIIVAGWGTLMVMVDLFLPGKRRVATALLSLLGLAGAGVTLALQALGRLPGAGESAFSGMVTVDGFSLFLQGTFILTGMVGILVAIHYLERRGIERGEYYTLLLFTVTGMMLMAMANNLIVIFLAIELLSIPLYILSGFAKPQAASEEAAVKYFLLGAFSSGFLVYGIALVYGGTGSTDLGAILAALGAAPQIPVLAYAGMGLLLVGFGFKVAAVPFHMWTPDVYQGAPTSVTAFMSVGAKAGGFAALLRVMVLAFPSLGSQWGALLAIIAGLTLVVGNVVAISQTDVKRMLGYSSIAHAGYILLAVAAAQYPNVTDRAVSAAIFYLLTYTLTNLGAFAIVIAVEKDDGGGTDFEDFAGLSKTRPFLAAAMLLFMLSLTGLPPSAGMVGKFFVFQAAIQAGSGDLLLLIITVIGVLTSVVSAFYYIRIVVMMYMREGAGEVQLKPALAAAVGLMTLATFILGIAPNLVFNMAQDALLRIAG